MASSVNWLSTCTAISTLDISTIVPPLSHAAQFEIKFSELIGGLQGLLSLRNGWFVGEWKTAQVTGGGGLVWVAGASRRSGCYKSGGGRDECCYRFGSLITGRSRAVIGCMYCRWMCQMHYLNYLRCYVYAIHSFLHSFTI